MTRLTQKVEMKIQSKLPDSFAVVFEGWSVGPTHYINLFATFPAQLLTKFDKILFGIAPMGETLSQFAKKHVDFLNFVLGSFERLRNSGATLIEDDANINQYFARKYQAVFICF